MAFGTERHWSGWNFFICYMVSLGQIAFGYPASIIGVTLAQPSFLIYMGLLDVTQDPPALASGIGITRTAQFSVNSQSHRSRSTHRRHVRGKLKPLLVHRALTGHTGSLFIIDLSLGSRVELHVFSHCLVIRLLFANGVY